MFLDISSKNLLGCGPLFIFLFRHIVLTSSNRLKSYSMLSLIKNVTGMGKERTFPWWKKNSSTLVQPKNYRPMCSSWKVPYEIVFLLWWVSSIVIHAFTLIYPLFILMKLLQEGSNSQPLGRTLFSNRFSMKDTRKNGSTSEGLSSMFRKSRYFF